MDTNIQLIDQAVEYIKAQPGFEKPEFGIILGSGLGRLGDEIEATAILPYSDIPNFCKATALGHKGNLILGTLSGKPVVAMQGRFHYYEGHSMQNATLPVRVMKRLGVGTMLISNAAGGLNTDFKVGDLMIIEDHISFLPNPLIGENLSEFGERFPDMTCAYDKELISAAEKIASKLGIRVQKGIYVAGTGPSYETPAEVRFFRMIGGDAVGMSTVHEVITARHCGMRVFAMSVISNMSNDTTESRVLNDADDVIRAADIAGENMSAIFKGIMKSF